MTTEALHDLSALTRAAAPARCLAIDGGADPSPRVVDPRPPLCPSGSPGIAEGAAARKEHDMTMQEEVRAACGILAEHTDPVAENLNAVATLQGLAGRYRRAAAAAPVTAPAPRAPTPVPEPAFDVEGIYARRRAAVVAAQAAQRGTP